MWEGLRTTDKGRQTKQSITDFVTSYCYAPSHNNNMGAVSLIKDYAEGSDGHGTLMVGSAKYEGPHVHTSVFLIKSQMLKSRERRQLQHPRCIQSHFKTHFMQDCQCMET